MLVTNNSLLRHRQRSPLAIVPILLMVALLGSQLIGVQHDHDGDLTHHVDCSVCVKQSNESDFLVVGDHVPIAAISDARSNNPALTIVSSAPLTVNSRSPPLF